MGAKAKVFCGVILFFIVFGLRFFCATCQRYPSQQQQLQMQTFQQHIPHQQLQAVTIPIQKDLLPNENRLQSQVHLCSRGRFVFPCLKRTRKPYFFTLPVPVRSTVQTTTSIPRLVPIAVRGTVQTTVSLPRLVPIPVRSTVQTSARVPQVVLRTGASLIVQDDSVTAGGQKEYYSNWSHIDNSHPDNQEQIGESQRRPGKNCKRKRRPPQISTTESPPQIPQQQYWPGHVEDDQPKIPQVHQQLVPYPTSISERIREPSTTKFAERIGEAYPSRLLEIPQKPATIQVSERNREVISLDYPDVARRPLSPTIYSEKIREFNPTKESLIARQPITSTVFDKIPEAAPTRISERNRENFSTKSAEKIQQDVSKITEKIREHNSKREPLTTRVSERIREPLAALEKEQKLFEIRDKHRQEFVAEVTAGYHDKSYRRPPSQARKETTQQPYPSREETESKLQSPRSPIDLKKILKNSGGLSLSEILQQKNLSLDDLLKGKQNALLALQTTASAPQKSEEANSRERFSKPARRIPVMGSTSTSTTTTTTTTKPESPITNRSVEEASLQSGESLDLFSTENTSKEIEGAKNVSTVRKYLKFPSRIRTNPSTRRQQLFDTTLQQRFSTTTTTTIKPSTTRTPLYKKRPHTRPSLTRNSNVKKSDISSSSSSESREASGDSLESSLEASTLNYPKRSRFRPSTTTTSESFVDQTDPTSNFVEDSGENEVLLQTTEVQNGSFSAENNSMIAASHSEEEQINTKEQEEPTTDHIYRYNSLKNYIDNNLPHAVFMDIDLADIDPVDDRTDLLELIEDRRSGNRLIKVLEQRNMTLEELIEHRKRGSSQLHLATFVQNRSGVFPGKKVVMNDDMDIVTAFENFPHFNLLNLKSVKPDEIKTDSQGSSYFTSIIDIEPTDEALKDGSGSGGSPKNSIRNPNNIQRQPFYPSWKSLALASLTTSENARRFLQRSDPEPPQQTAQRHQSTVVEEDPIFQIEDEVARAHDLIDLELSGHGFKRSAMNMMHTSQMPAGIRSAIVASAAIVLTSLVTFMMIFVACRWKQRRRRLKLDYMETYNAMKSKIPVISSRRTDALATSMTSLGVESAPTRISRSNSRQSQTKGHHPRHQISIVFPSDVDGSRYPSASSVQSSKLNTMDPSSPEVQEYLFDALRKSF